VGDAARLEHGLAGARLDELFERRRRYLSEAEDILVAGWGEGDPALRRASIALAVDFPTWRLLVRGRDLGDAEAVELVTRAVVCAGASA